MTSGLGFRYPVTRLPGRNRFRVRRQNGDAIAEMIRRTTISGYSACRVESRQGPKTLSQNAVCRQGISLPFWV